MFPRPLATNIIFQYTVTGDLSCMHGMECMIYGSLFVFCSLCINVSGGSRKTTLMWLCCSPPFPQVYQYMYYYSICTKSEIWK